MDAKGARKSLRSIVILDLMRGSLLGLALCCGPVAWAQEWPNARSIRMIVPFPPGGAGDVTGRLVAEALSRQLNQAVVVENIAGAAGNNGTTVAANSSPDGYTILMTGDPIVGSAYVTKISYDPIKDFVPVIQLTRQPIVMAVNPSIGINSLADLIRVSKEQPGLTFGTTGVGTSQHLVAEWFAKRAGIALVHVPYRGGAPALNDALAGHIKMVVLGSTPIIPQHRAGLLKAIGQSTRARARSLPDVQTFAEAGFPEIELDQWLAVFAPRGTPAGIVARLNLEFGKILASPDVAGKLAQNALEPIGGTSDDLARVMQTEGEKYGRLMKELGIQVQK